MPNAQSSYRQIMKATSIFGGVQVFNILIQIIRSKVVAVLLGPAGMGIMGLLTTTINLVGNLTNFGLNVSAVKDVAAAHSTNDTQRVATVVSIFRRIVWITGTFGAVVALIFSHWLSLLTFGNGDYTIAFAWISITLLINQVSSSQIVILQGMRQLKLLAKANLLGSLLGLITTIPLYYFWGVKGIAPAIIAISVSTLLFSYYFSHKIAIPSVSVTRSQTISEGKEMLRMGFLISMSSLLTVAASYIVRVYIGRYGGIDQVGLYTAGFAIINTYVGLIFSAMATDYYPRLAAVAKSNSRCRKTINQQAEIAILILAPILVVFLVFIKWVVILLYSYQFIAINTMIYWAVLGMFFKAACWSVGFLLLAKGASKLFFWNELIVNIYMLIFNIAGYYWGGLTGLGISFAVTYLLYLVQIYTICSRKFNFAFNREFTRIFLIQFSLALGTFVVTMWIPQPLSYIVGSILIAISAIYSFKNIKKRIWS